jgi:hypothetical protein
MRRHLSGVVPSQRSLSPCTISIGLRKVGTRLILMQSSELNSILLCNLRPIRGARVLLTLGSELQIMHVDSDDELQVVFSKQQ